jgi:hypothetical protein
MKAAKTTETTGATVDTAVMFSPYIVGEVSNSHKRSVIGIVNTERESPSRFSPITPAKY